TARVNPNDAASVEEAPCRPAGCWPAGRKPGRNRRARPATSFLACPRACFWAAGGHHPHRPRACDVVIGPWRSPGFARPTCGGGKSSISTPPALTGRLVTHPPDRDVLAHPCAPALLRCRSLAFPFDSVP